MTTSGTEKSATALTVEPHYQHHEQSNQREEDQSGFTTPAISEARSSFEEREQNKPSNERTHSYDANSAVYIDWEADDAGHPWNWSPAKKWVGLLIACLFNSSTAMNATGYTTTEELGAHALGVTGPVYLTGSSAYLISVAIAPLFLAPLSEVFGRRGVCLATILLYTLMFIPQATATNMFAIWLPRIVQGITGSVGNTMVGGFVADMWPKASRSLPMSVFVLSVLLSQAVGSAASAWTVSNPSLGWRSVFWWQGIVAFVTFLVMIALLPETRAEVLLSRRGKRLTKETGREHRTHMDDDGHHLLRAIARNCSRPIVFFFTEPIITALALWSGFIWGVVFLSLRSVKYTFDVYNLSPPLKSTILLAYGAGAILGFVSNVHQTLFYNRVARKSSLGKAAPEARLLWCMPAAVFTTAGLFWYGWTAMPQIHIVVPIIGLIVFAWGTYIIYLSTLVYIADAYETFSSSGIACQALVRNLTAGILSAVSDPIYTSIEPAIASSVLGGIAGLLGLAPFVLYFWGDKLRAMSPVTSQLLRQEDEALEKETQIEQHRATPGNAEAYRKGSV